ncbi:ATP-binding protein [Streptomyces sp. Z26]|uniref:ATP-binding protein n=1 Tax=Streptomyces sp. Z26 TaxID=2500177 RepID=UPI0026CA45D3
MDEYAAVARTSPAARAVREDVPVDGLVGRDGELERLHRAVDGLPPAERVLVLAGDAGAGKSALLDAAVRRAEGRGVQVLRAVGSEAEAPLAYSGLHQLLWRVPWGTGNRGGLGEPGSLRLLSGRQRAALAAVFGRGDAPEPPDRMLVGLAVLTLLSDLSDRAPLLLALDDAQWLDHASLDALAFAARRLDAEPVTVLAGVRTGEPLPDLGARQPPLVLGPLDPAAADRLLDLQPQSPAGRLRTRVLDQARGNPLALTILAGAGEPPGGAPYAGPLPLAEHVEHVLAGRLVGLPAATTDALLLLAAADAADDGAVRPGPPGGDDPVWAPAEAAGLVRAGGGRVRFRHPLMRSAVYHAAPAPARRAAHRALAGALRREPDRCAWHLAAAADGPDARVAAALEESADRARRRGGYAAAARALQRAAELAPERADGARLLVAAASDAVLTGDLAWVDELADAVRRRTDDGALSAAAALHAGRLAAFTPHHGTAFARLAGAAERWAADQPGAALDLLAAAAVVGFYSGDDRRRQHVRHLLHRLCGEGERADPYGWPQVWIAVVTDPYEHRTALVPRLPELFASAGQRPEHLTALAILAWLVDETPRAVRAFDEAEEGWRVRGALPEGLGGAAAWAYAEQGRWDRARELCRRMTANATAVGLDHAEACAAAVDAAVLAFRGDIAAARARAADALALVDPGESRSVAVYVRRALAAAAAAEGAYDTAYDQLRAVFTADGAPLHHHASYPALADLASAAVRSGHEAHRAQAAAIVERAARRFGTGRPADTGGPSASPRLRALLARARAPGVPGRSRDTPPCRARPDRPGAVAVRVCPDAAGPGGMVAAAAAHHRGAAPARRRAGDLRTVGGAPLGGTHPCGVARCGRRRAGRAARRAGRTLPAAAGDRRARRTGPDQPGDR